MCPPEYLYSITHLKNLESIATHEALSHNRAADYSPVDISAPSVQGRRKRSDPIITPLHDYVPLYFRARNPMLYRRVRSKTNLQFDVL